MKITLFCYSATGNTMLACSYLEQMIPNVDIVDIADFPQKTISNFDIAGFACPTYYFGIPPIVKTFIGALKQDHSKPAFILATFGMIQGKVLTDLAKSVSNKGFFVIDGHALRMPENYPPFLLKGWSAEDAPNEKEKSGFDCFINSVVKKIMLIETGKIILRKKISVGLLNTIIPKPSHKKIMKQFGSLRLDSKLCNSCGICRTSCSYDAIRYTTSPVFEMNSCIACFNCYNKCPKKAISTSAFSKVKQYAGPGAILKEYFR
jgi:ferredoxin/flavodoxin